MVDVTIQRLYGPRISPVLVATDNQPPTSASNLLQKLPHIFLDRLRIWASQPPFQFRSVLFLVIGHPPLPA
jgi:hypothetical protein